MKKLSLLFLLPILFFSCSSDDNDNEPKQDYTSFVFMHNEPITLNFCVVAYLDKNNHFIKIADLGTLKQNIPSKEVVVENESIREIYLFQIGEDKAIRTDAVFTLKKSKKNTFEITKDTRGIEIEDMKDSTQCPQ